jgi:cellulose synthase/poly-beta-1,6-N-acetylglucosamine synthase-like glycosyltransferase
MSVYGWHALMMTILYLMRFRKALPTAEAPREWPRVCVQLPLYNEQSVAERMIDTVCAFDYPKDKLIIQILDDSTDGTTDMACQRVQHYRELGYQMEMFHRTNRTGYKAGALSAATAQTDAEFIVIFDADFVPQPDYLRKVLPYFNNDPQIGLVQARWGHLNRDENLLTRAQALFLDGHQVVEQVSRSRSSLLLNFNGTCGIWRAACIRDCGGWQWDTLSEDIDISYRAQMAGWRLLFVPDLVVPGEVPPTLTFFKKQQYRWTFGHIQVFRKLARQLWTTPGLTLAQRLGGTFHLTANFVQIGALVMSLLTIPLALTHLKQPVFLGIVSLASFGPTILFAVSQIFGYKDGFVRTVDRLANLPFMIFLAVGLTISNSWAVLNVFLGRVPYWSVTPKLNGKSRGGDQHGVPWSVWAEIGMSIYCAIGLSLAMMRAHEIIPLAALGMLSYGFVGFTGLVESNRPRKPRSVGELARE